MITVYPSILYAISYLSVIPFDYLTYFTISQQHHPLPFYTHGVMFPDCNFQLQNEVNEWQWRIFDRRDGENIVSYINKLIGKTRQRFRDKRGFDARKPSLEEINALADYLTPSTKEITHQEWVEIIESQQA
jgi:hypothetical protein